jgi:hypothetical protein
MKTLAIFLALAFAQNAAYGTGTWTFARSADGKTTTVTKPDGSVAVYTYGPTDAGRPIGPLVKIIEYSDVAVGQTYTYDGAGRVTEIHPVMPPIYSIAPKKGWPVPVLCVNGNCKDAISFRLEQLDQK